MRHSAKYYAILLISLMFSVLSLQVVQANGVKATTHYGNAKYKITLASQEKNKGIKIISYSTSNGKVINITYSLDSKAAGTASIEISEAMVLAPFRVITTNTNNLNYRPFKDILNTEADEYIRHLHDIGITNGFSDGTFKPGNTITRAEAAVMLTTALKLNTVNTSEFDSKFKDIKKHWAKKYINAILKKGIMSGSNQLFRPNDKITVAEVSSILSKSFSFKTKAQGVFTKLKENKWYSSYVLNMFDMRILTPRDSIYKEFNEESYINRGGFAIMLSRALSTY